MVSVIEYRSEMVVRQSEKRYRLLAENVTDVIWTADFYNPVRLNYISPSVTRLLGYTVEEAMGKKPDEVWTPSSLKIMDKAIKECTDIMRNRQNGHASQETLDLEMYRKDGSIVPVEIKASVITECGGQPAEFLVVARDVTERKNAQAALTESEAKYRSLIETASAGIIIFDYEGNISFANRTIREMTGYTDEEIMRKHIGVFIVPEDLRDVMTRFKKARAGLTGKGVDFRVVCKDGRLLWFHTNPKPIRITGKAVGFSAVLMDITERRKIQEDLALSLKKLKRALLYSIDVAAKMVEMRDPYTAGHQQKVAELSVAIARELGLPEEQLEYIGLAATVHDIGKIYVPSEILNRTGKLTRLEYQMMKTHAQGSYDILKKIEFPWPIAQIALQHHERMDGSGYPHGLKGDEILIEARILAVADTVEAMSTHRPYREALGMAPALEEINKNRAILYDADVVDACLRLFSQKGYKFR